jgi:hypothetical protein
LQLKRRTLGSGTDMARRDLTPLVLAIVLTSGCAPSGQSLTPDERLLIQAYEHALDSLARPEGGSHRTCIALDHGLETSDPPAAVVRTLREKERSLLAYSECRLGLSIPAPAHDTLLVSVGLDSVAATTPRLTMRTWRGGRWGAGYSCSVRDLGESWALGRCQVAWIN